MTVALDGTATAVVAMRERSNVSRVAAATPSVPARAHLPALDGVRGVAILLVLMDHFLNVRPVTTIEHVVHSLAAAGWIGVDLFFVLSGFLITGILFDAKSDDGYFRNFYMRRVLRIFPLYYGILALYLFVLPIIPRISPDVYQSLREHQAWFWTYLTNISIAIGGYEHQVPRGWGHFWSLAVEEQFYLVWPAIVFLCSRHRLIAVCCGCIVTATAIRVGLAVAGADPWASYVLTVTRMDALATGAILALLIRGPVNIGQLVKIARRTFVVACVVVACLFVWRLGLDALDPVFQILGFPALACGFAALIALAVLDSAGRLAAIFSHPALRFWGKYSYGLYVVHRAVGNPLTAWIDPNRIPLWLGSQFPRVLLLMIVNTAATLTVAMASWHFYEKHFLKLKDRFSHGVQQRATFRYR